MTEKMRSDFKEFVQSQADIQGNYVGDHYELWKTATALERERCLKIAKATHLPSAAVHCIECGK